MKNYFPGVTNKVPFTLHPLVPLLHNSTTAKEQKNVPGHCLKKRASKLVWSLPEWKKWEKGRGFVCPCIKERCKI